MKCFFTLQLLLTDMMQFLSFLFHHWLGDIFKWDFFNQPITSQKTRGLPRAPRPPPLLSLAAGELLNPLRQRLDIRFSANEERATVASSRLLRGSFCCSLASVRCAHSGEESRRPKHTPSPHNIRNICTHANQYMSPAQL